MVPVQSKVAPKSLGVKVTAKVSTPAKPVVKPVVKAAMPVVPKPGAAGGPNLKSLGYKLNPGQTMKEGEMIVSPKGTTKAVLYKGRLAVWKDGKEIWHWGETGGASAIVKAVMQTDSNFVVYNSAGKALAASDTTPYKGCYLAAEEGNLIVRDYGNSPKWDVFSGTATRSAWQHVTDPIESGAKWTANAASVAGRTVTHTVATGIKSAGDLVGKIPIVGSPLHGALMLSISGPFTLIDNIASGARIDKALMAEYTDKISCIREVAPYAQLVVGAIPGLGSGVSAALAFSVSLASGMPIDKALIDACAAAVPGGALAKVVLNFTQQVVSGENVLKATANTALAQLPKAAREGLDLVQRAMQGENIPNLALEKARALLPKEVQAAFDVGIAIGQGKNLQKVIVSKIASLAPADITKFATEGLAVIQTTPVFAAAYKMAKNANEQRGFQVGTAVLGFSGVNTKSIEQFRAKLDVQARIGFDLAVSTRIGKVTAPPPPKTVAMKVPVITGQALKVTAKALPVVKTVPVPITTASAAAYYTTAGLVGASPKQVTAVTTIAASDTAARPGVVAALDVKADAKKKDSLIHKILHAIGLA